MSAAVADPFPCAARIGRAAARLEAAGAEALLVTHLPNLLYLSGLDASSAVGLLTRDGRLHLFTDFRYAAALDAQQHEVGDALVPHVLDAGPWTAPVLAECSAAGVELLAVEDDHLTLADARRLEQAAAAAGQACTLVPGQGLVEHLRLVKDEGELAILREAGARLSEVARAILRDGVVAVGRQEIEVAADVDARMRRAGFSRPAFETIVGSGPNSALPHARPTERRLAPGDPVVLDFGGVFRRYCVDLTRTLCLGAASSALERMYTAVAEAQQAAFAVLAPGTAPSAVDGAARRVLEAAGLGEAFGHGTGHGLGLEVHEAPRLGRPRVSGPAESPLAAGTVCTIEPGAYVVGTGGIRIEDDVAITATGHERLTDVPLGWPSA